MQTATMWRACVRAVERDTVRRAVQRAGGIRSWDDPPREHYQVGTATVEVFADQGTFAILINDTTSKRVREAADRLGIDLAEATVWPLRGANA